MKRILKIVLALTLLTGCTQLDNSEGQDSLSKYESYLNTLIEHDRYTEASSNYDIYAILNKLSDGTTRYDVIIENPDIAMYNIQALVVENSAKKTDTIIYPSIGIFDTESYNMIPNQVNEEQGYIEALCLSGVSKEEEPILNVLVIWTDYAKTTTNREFIKLFPSAETEEEEVIDETAEEGTASDVATEDDTNE